MAKKKENQNKNGAVSLGTSTHFWYVETLSPCSEITYEHQLLYIMDKGPKSLAERKKEIYDVSIFFLFNYMVQEE